MTGLIADVTVIGGGIHGCSTALHLAKRGYKVIQVEKNSVARHASGVNAGGVRLLMRDPAEIPLSIASLELWKRLPELVGADCGFQASSHIAVAETDTDLNSLEQRAAGVRALGYDHEEVISRDELRQLLPAVAPHCIGGLISRGDGFASPYQTTRAFWHAALDSGVHTLTGCSATEFHRAHGTWTIQTTQGQIQSKFLVNTGGAWASAIAEQLGEPVPLQPVAPMMMVTSRIEPFVTPVVIAVSRKLSFKQMPNGTVVIGGGHFGRVDMAHETTVLDFSLLAKSARTVSDLFPIMRKTRIVRGWSGIESRLPDDIPVIGASCTEQDAYHAFGFSLHGFQLGPIVGSILAELIDTGSSSLPIDAFAISRFRKPADSRPKLNSWA